MFTFIKDESDYKNWKDSYYKNTINPKPNRYPCVISVTWVCDNDFNFDYMYMDDPVINMINQHKKSAESSWVSNQWWSTQSRRDKE